MRSDRNNQPPIADVPAGMRVIDRAGDEVGVVKLVRMGGPQAVTTEGQGEGGDMMDTVAGLVSEGEPDVPNQFAAQLLRTGYLKIGCWGLFGGNLSTPADEVTAVHEETVQLSSTRESLISES